MTMKMASTMPCSKKERINRRETEEITAANEWVVIQCIGSSADSNIFHVFSECVGVWFSSRIT